MKTNISSLLAVVLAFAATASYGALISNGDMNTAVSTQPDTHGGTILGVDQSDGTITGGINDPVVASVNEWVLTTLTRGFTYDATGGRDGTGGFVRRATNQNAKPRGFVFFAQDDKATTGSQIISMDSLVIDANSGLSVNVQLYAWNFGQTGAQLGVGGDNADTFVFDYDVLGDAVKLLETSIVETTGEWATTELGTAELGTGYDYYAWRISVVGAGGADTFSVDNLTVIPEPATLGMVAAFGGAVLFIRRRLMM